MVALRALFFDQTDLFVTTLKFPEGFEGREDVLSPDEEQAMLAYFKELPFKPFDFHGFLGKHRVISFGWRCNYTGKALRESDPIPSMLLPLRARAASFAGISEDSLQQILINEYEPGAGIGWHRDKPMFEGVIGISLGGPCQLRFRRKNGFTWDRITCNARPRTAYLLRGPARQRWEHSMSPVERLRYSLTFRNFIGSN
jgi:alkylated DNA repair dioxygenase AlkB